MKRSSRKTWLALCIVALAGCSAALDFDRSKIDDEDASLTDARVPDMDASMDAAREASTTTPDAELEASLPDATPPDSGMACTSNDQCGADQLCCDGKCKPTSVQDSCEGCGSRCTGNASECTDRSCRCGGSPACSGATPLCDSTSGAAPHCVECLDDDDCPAGKKQCVAGICRECDSSDTNSSCANPTPICDSNNTCQGCSASGARACPGGLTCVAGSGCFGCNLTTDAPCTGTTPRCAPGGANGNSCQPCLAGECPAGAAQCLSTGACAACNPANNAGCDPASATPVCNGAANPIACRACNPANGSDCPMGSVCSPTGLPTAGRCVKCTTNAQCAGATPICNVATGQCRACAADTECPAAAPACLSGQCVVCRPGGASACAAPNEVCAPAGGSCIDCDPATHNGCAANQYCTAASTCAVGCRNNAGCTTPGLTFCDATSHQCRGCTIATEATDCSSPAAPRCAGNGTCGACRTGATALCTGTTDACDNTTGTCVDCIAGAGPVDQGCTTPAGRARCLVGVTPSANQCVACLSPADCNDGYSCTAPACTANACVETPGACAGSTLCAPITCSPGPTTPAGTGCVPGTPVACGDGGVCNTDSGVCGP